jgi:hypothetical protein
MKNGADVNANSLDGGTALFVACQVIIGNQLLCLYSVFSDLKKIPYCG